MRHSNNGPGPGPFLNFKCVTGNASRFPVLDLSSYGRKLFPSVPTCTGRQHFSVHALADASTETLPLLVLP